jgi:hypothetical protein
MYFEGIGLKVLRTPMDYSRGRAIGGARKAGARVFGHSFSSIPSTSYLHNGRSGGVTMHVMEHEWSDEFIPIAHGELDPAKREEMLRQILKFWLDNWVSAPLVEAPGIWGMTDKIGEHPLRLGVAFPTNMMEYATVSDSVKAELMK